MGVDVFPGYIYMSKVYIAAERGREGKAGAEVNLRARVMCRARRRLSECVPRGGRACAFRVGFSGFLSREILPFLDD